MLWLGLIVGPIIGVIAAGIVIFLENRNVEKAISWLSVMAMFPVVGFIIYLLFGYNLRRKQLFRDKHLENSNLRHIAREQKDKLDQLEFLSRDPDHGNLVKLLLNSGLAPLTLNNKVSVLTNGEEKFNSLIKALENANHHIHMEYYIFKDDEIGQDIQKLLIRRAKEGLEVRLIVDGWGSSKLSRSVISRMKDSGVKVEVFLPVKFPYLSSKLNYRNHRKIVVIDGETGFTGGLNIGDEYLSRDKAKGYWRDTHLHIEGDAVHSLQAAFLNDWHFITRQVIDGPDYYPDFKQSFPDTLPVQVIASGPDSGSEPMKQAFFSLLTSANHRIYLETPYFVPDDSMITALKVAAMSGIDVRLVLQGVPEYKLLHWASRSYFEDLMNAGVKIYTYQKGILHCKVLIIDSEIGFVGSANFDIRSFILNFEISALIFSQEFVSRLERDFFEDQANSIELNLKEFSSRPLIERFREANARLLEPLL
ncbi:MAG: cardiolipin synthase [Desulfitobacterium hafniense]|nr:cardiolipin synthase [Desulfitobacterium hafniense]